MTPGKLASSSQEDLGSSHLSIMSWTEITELISPGSNCWQFPVTTENQRFPCERVISLPIPNSVWPHPVWDEGCMLPFPQVALQKQLAWNDSTVILIYNQRAICSINYFCCLYSTFSREAPQSHFTIPPGNPARNEGTQRTGNTAHIFYFSSPSKTFSLVPQMPMSPSTSTTGDFESRVAVIYRGYNLRQSVLCL